MAETQEQYVTRQLSRAIEQIARDFRELAGTVERAAAEVATVGTKPHHDSYAAIVARIQREVPTALMNMHLDLLTQLAAQADVARAAGEREG